MSKQLTFAQVLEVRFVIPPRPSRPFCCTDRSLFFVLQELPKVSDMPCSYVPIDYMQGRIFAAKALCDDFTRVCSSNRFYAKQIEWSIETVCRYWHNVLKNPHFTSLKALETVTFCLSWILGTDVTIWPKSKLHAWFRAKLGNNPLWTDVQLKRVSVWRRAAPEAMPTLMAPPPVYGGYRVARPYTHDPRFTDTEYDAIDALAFLPYASMSRPYSPPAKVLSVSW